MVLGSSSIGLEPRTDHQSFYKAPGASSMIVTRDRWITLFASVDSLCKYLIPAHPVFFRLSHRKQNVNDSSLMFEPFRPEEGDKERLKFVKRFTPHISNSSPAALYESLQIVIGPNKSTKRYLTGTFEGTGFSNQSQAHSEASVTSPAPASLAIQNTDSSSYGSPLANQSYISDPLVMAAAPSPSSNAFAFENGFDAKPHSPLRISPSTALDSIEEHKLPPVNTTQALEPSPIPQAATNSSADENRTPNSENGASPGRCSGTSQQQQYPIDPNGPQPGLLFQMSNISVQNASSGPELHIQKHEFRYMPANMTSEEKASHAALLRNELNTLLQSPHFQQHAIQTGRKAYYIKPPSSSPAPSAAAGSPRDLIPTSAALGSSDLSALQIQQSQQMQPSLGMESQAFDSNSTITSSTQAEVSSPQQEFTSIDLRAFDPMDLQALDSLDLQVFDSNPTITSSTQAEDPFPPCPPSVDLAANRQPCKRRCLSPLLSSTSSDLSPSEASQMPYLIDPTDVAQSHTDIQVTAKRRKTDV